MASVFEHDMQVEAEEAQPSWLHESSTFSRRDVYVVCGCLIIVTARGSDEGIEDHTMQYEDDGDVSEDERLEAEANAGELCMQMTSLCLTCIHMQCWWTC